MGATIVWMRRDLRLADNPALAAAIERGEPVVPVFIWAPQEEDLGGPGAASRWWLHHSLAGLAARLQEKGARLVLRAGDSLAELRAIIKETGATAVHWNRVYEPALVARDAVIKKALREDGLDVKSHNASLLFEPWTIETKAGGPYKVFTQFWRMCLSQAPPHTPVPEPARVPGLEGNGPASVALESLALLPKIRWDKGLAEAWRPGEESASRLLERFLDGPVADYPEDRDRPDRVGTSRLSPHLHCGEIGPRTAWHAAHFAKDAAGSRKVATAVDKFLAEIGWREFAHHLLFHFPATLEQPLRPEFERFPWRDAKGEAADDLRAWQRGRTGFPIVDAGMRELWHTGWMHNRVRMIVGSLLVKHLLVTWREGEAWFRDTLVDADLASNTLGWQWIGGCGADAAPYFRVFNPITQGEKFDPDGAYVRRWVPEIAKLPNKFLNQPWEAPGHVLREAGVVLGETYPAPLVPHAEGRARALDAYEKVKKKNQPAAGDDA